jgi:poly-gamma-glutamate biosynthesis protein PgsC/CapC
MIIESIGVGLVLSLLFHEAMGLSPGGLVVPGYIAFILDQPGKLLGTLAASLVSLALIRFLSDRIVLYGRRKFVLTVMIGFGVVRILERLTISIPGLDMGLQAIGYVIPGLMANEMDRQGILKTLLFLVLVSSLVRFVLFLLKGWLFI